MIKCIVNKKTNAFSHFCETPTTENKDGEVVGAFLTNKEMRSPSRKVSDVSISLKM